MGPLPGQLPTWLRDDQIWSVCAPARGGKKPSHSLTYTSCSSGIVKEGWERVASPSEDRWLPIPRCSHSSRLFLDFRISPGIASKLKKTTKIKKRKKTVKRALKYIFKCLLKVEHFSIWPNPPTFRFLCGSHAQCLIGFCHNERARLASAIPFP